MDTNQPLTIITNNPFQNMGSFEYTRPNDIGNLSVNSPTIEQMNRAFGVTFVEKKREPAAIFGTHIREAVAIVKDWVAHP